MYLFRDKKEIEIPYTCKVCLAEIRFTILFEEYKNISTFPFKKESTHGEPKHKLIVFFNKNLEIEEFEIKDLLDEKEPSISIELTKQVLSEIGLTNEEIELYFLSTGREAASIGEMALLMNKSNEECLQIAEKFVKKGLFKHIIGSTPHYKGLPPYAALVSQLQKFYHLIENIRTEAPAQLSQSFSELEAKTEGIEDLKDFTSYMTEFKDNFNNKMTSYTQEFDSTISEIDKIREINDVISNLTDNTKSIISSQIEELSNQFDDIKVLINKNLQKLQLGIIGKTVSRVIDNVLKTRLNEINKKLNNQFTLKIGDITDDIIKKIEGITTSTVEKSRDIKGSFTTLSKDISSTIMVSEEKVRNISENISTSIKDLKNTFSTKVIHTLNEQLTTILNWIDTSKTTTEEFWNKAKEVSFITMKDIWFIRSIESVKSHINNIIKKVKMRLLIVAPLITDINIELLKKCPKHINIRIVTFFDKNSKEHIKILKEFDNMPNLSFRHREVQNLWGINRDFEEVILCVVSTVEIGDTIKTEIGGIGSMVQEDIKIFVPILEDAWISAAKKVEYNSDNQESEEP